MSSDTHASLARNRGLISPKEQQFLQRSHVLIAGVGGVGGRTAETLARLGVGALTVADPDVFTESNLNRQAGATIGTLGLNKADVIAAVCLSIGTGVTVRSASEGITETNIENLLADVDLVIDGTDYTRPDIGLRLARTARHRGIPVLLAVEVGFGVWHTAIQPTKGTFESLFGIRPNVEPEDLVSGRARIPLWRWVLSIPSYADIRVLKAVENGELESPALAPAVELSAALLSTSAVAILTGSAPVATAPQVHHVDLRTGKAKRFRPSAARFYVSAMRATLRRTG